MAKFVLGDGRELERLENGAVVLSAVIGVPPATLTVSAAFTKEEWAEAMATMANVAPDKVPALTLTALKLHEGEELKTKEEWATDDAPLAGGK